MNEPAQGSATVSQAFAYQLHDAYAAYARLGLVVLQVDETIEHEFARLLPPSVASLNVTRVPSAPDVTPETLAQMAAQLPAAAALLPNSFRHDAVAYACTSGTTVIGVARVAELVHSGCDTAAVTNPLTALIAACAHLGVKRLALLSPYVESVSERLRQRLGEAGIDTPHFGSFNESAEAKVARIDGESVLQAATALGQHADCDAVFLSCTNLRTLDVIDAIEAQIAKPVLSSNQVLAWHLAQLAGLTLEHAGGGRLWRQA